MKRETEALKIVENAQRGEIFADDAVSFSLINGVIRATLTATRPLPAQGAEQLGRVVIGRLAMPLPGARALAIELYDFLQSEGAIAEGGETH